MQIILMEEEHLETIIELDQMVFQREEPRSIQNLQGLMRGDEDGCYVLMDGQGMVGYSFSKTMGDEGYLGPLGIHPSIQGQGKGKKLIQHSLDYLQSHCKVVGLEVRPEAGNNLGLYHKLGFHSTYPSLILKVPEKLPCPEGKANIGVGVNQDVDNFKVELFQPALDDRKESVLEKIDNWARQELGGVSYLKDLNLASKGGGDILIALYNDEPVGFLTFYPSVFLHLWGVVKPHPHQDHILKEMLMLFRESHGPGEVLLEVNTRYHNLVDFLLKEDFRIEKSVVRMLLEDFEGEHLKKSQNMVMRAWHA